MTPKMPLAVALLCLSAVAIGQPTAWNFDLGSTGEDVFWLSDTTVDTLGDEYELTYQIEMMEVKAKWGILPAIWVDVTDELDPEFQQSTLLQNGPLPIFMFDDDVQQPPDDPNPGFAAHITIGVDETGHGFIDMTDVLLDEMEVYADGIGWITVRLLEIHLTGQLTAEPFYYPQDHGDLNCDGAVDFGDINPFVLALSGQEGYYAAYPDCNWLNADCNDDGIVDFGDINAFVAVLSGS